MEWLRKLFGLGDRVSPEEEHVPEQMEQPVQATRPPLPDIDLATAPSQGFAQPYFRFFPGAYDFGEGGEEVFKRQEGPCHCCGMRDIYAYQGSIYWLRRDNPTVCAVCLAEGRLAKLLSEGEHYSLHDWSIEGVSKDDPAIEEIDQRTPGFATYNPFHWATMDGKPMAFMGYGDEKKWKYVGEALEAMREANGGEDAYPSSYFLLFKELDSTRYRTTLDLD